MELDRAVAIVGVGSIFPDAPDTAAFWANLSAGRYSITDVTDRWDAALYYDPDPKAPDKTYSKIGGWVRSYPWEPTAWRLPIPPRVAAQMDRAQRWSIAACREALLDYGYPQRPLNPENVAVIFGNALGGDNHLLTVARILFPEFGEELTKAPSFRALPAEVRAAVFEEMRAGVGRRLPEITEDTMPGELGNIVAGRVAQLWDFKGPNYISDAACASTLAAMTGAVQGLVQGDYDAVLTGGIDANMNASTFVKFCKIGALSGRDSRPYAEGADGFVMGEGAGVLLLKRLADAERDGDRIYAVIVGMGASSDGKGKGITAPNPAGQRFAVERGWRRAGAVLQPGDMIEGHGTSTKVGDVAELEVLDRVFGSQGIPARSVALGSVKSNIGHLKSGAGAAGLLKAALALHHKTLLPSANFPAPNPAYDFARSPFEVITQARPWEKTAGDGVRRAGVSAFGFGGTNFHFVLEEYVPGLRRPKKAIAQGAEMAGGAAGHGAGGPGAPAPKPPLRGALLVGGADDAAVATRLREIAARATTGWMPPLAAPSESDLDAGVRVALDFGDATELAELAGKAAAALEAGDPGRWKALRNKGVYLGRGPKPGKVAFLFPGQGSQYVGMLGGLKAVEPIVQQTFDEADKVMTPLLGGMPLSAKIFVDSSDPERVAAAEEALKQTAVTQPAVLTVDTALFRLYQAWGVEPDMVMGHSLGEYGALVAAGAMPFGDALVAVAARGDAMTRLALEDNGLMAAVFGPLEQVNAIVAGVDGYVVVANVNSTKECVIGGETQGVRNAIAALQGAGMKVIQLPVSHAFHTRIVEPAAAPLRDVLRGLGLEAPRIPVVANVNAGLYPTGPDAKERMVDILGRQIGSPVQWVKGLNALYDAGCRVFVEMGPKRALYGMAEDVVGGREGVSVLFTNHPKTPDVVQVNRTLCGLWALGLGRGVSARQAEAPVAAAVAPVAPARAAAPAAPVVRSQAAVASAPPPAPAPTLRSAAPSGSAPEDRYVTLGRMFADFLDKSFEAYACGPAREKAPPRIGITGVGLGLPGSARVFDDASLEKIMRGEVFISAVPKELRESVLDKNIRRLVKTSDGAARFETITDPDEVIKLAGRGGALDLVAEYGFPEDRLHALDRATRLAIAAGIDALRDAGIPLVRRYKTTSTGSKLPAGWALPEDMRDDTAVVFGSAWPGYDWLIRIIEGYWEDKNRRDRLAELKGARPHVSGPAAAEMDARIAALEGELAANPHHFDRRFLFQVLNMGHAQFAEYIGARGPNYGTNGACATATQAVGLAQDLIREGRARRVIVITGDDPTTDDMFRWFSAGFLASGTAATDERVEDAALPFDRRRHGLIVGMGGAALVIESLDAAAERGVSPLCEVMGTVVANSAYHGSRLDVEHIVGVMEKLVSEFEARWGISRREIAREMVFVSHETYTPARGGSASAEVHALRKVFGPDVDSIVIANTKGYTGHAMAVGIEDALAVRMLETGIVPPVPNLREMDPELGPLNLSKGGSHPVRWVLRLGAGFGSQIAMSLLRWTPPPDGQRRAVSDLGFHHRVADPGVWAGWLARVTGYDAPELEVVQRTLRVKDQGAPGVAAAPAEVRRAAVPPAAVGSGVPTLTSAAPAVVAPAVATAPAAQVPAAPAAAPAPPPAPAADPVAERVLQIVSEQTGYPRDMLAMDLDLEADLGIDTVKQAEMFAAIRGAYGIERDENLALRDYPTLGRAIEFVYEKRPELKGASGVGAAAPVAEAGVNAAASAVAPAAAPAAPPALDPVAERVLGIVAEQTGYPPDMLAMDLDLEADLGIDTVKQAEMFAAIRGAYGIERDENLALRDYPTLGRAIEFVYEKRPDLKGAVAAPAGAVSAAAAAVAAPAAAIAVTPAAGGAANPVAARVLQIVAEQTGYPPDMLELDLDLEADLGIDTVKQAEMFAAIRAAYDIERDESLALRDYPTLGRAIEFVFEKRPELRDAAGALSAPAGTPAHAAAAGVYLATLEELADVRSDPLRGSGKGPLGSADTSTAAPAVAKASAQLDAFSQPAPVAAPAPAPAPAPAAPSAAPAGVDDPVAATVLGIVAEQTGYPPDMLEMELDLEADLGIDTVKQAEMFAAIRAAYGIERDENLALRDYPTLARAVEFVYERRPDLKAAAAPAVAAVHAPAEGASAEPAPAAPAEASQAAPGAFPRGSLPAAQAVPRRVPVSQVRPAAERFPETGVQLGGGARVVVVPDEMGVGTALVERLQKLGAEVMLADPSMGTDELIEAVGAWRGETPVTGLYWLPALDPVLPDELTEPADRREALRRRVKALHALARMLYDDLAGPGSFLVSGVRLGGRHGYEPDGALDAPGGAVVGFTKAFGRERPGVLVKAVDFEMSRKTAALADVLILETKRDAGVVEVGYVRDRRWAVTLEERPVEPGEALPSEAVWLVTGAAGSITSAIVADLAQGGGTFWLLDLAPEPDAADPDLARVTTDRDGLKRDLFHRMQAGGARVTPVQVEREVARLERAAAALGAVKAIESAGGTVRYRSVDLRNAEAVGAVVRELVEAHGRVDVLLHAAGLEISRTLPDKTPEEFALVFDVKVEGWYNLIAALGSTSVGSVMTFSSIAGRFGNAGQTDYAAANDLLCKAVSEMARTRPETRALSVDWTAWRDIGMAARGSIPAIMKAAGIDMLPPDAGIGVVRRELTAGTRGEVVIAMGLGVMLAEDPDQARLDGAYTANIPAGPMLDRVAEVSLYRGLVVETELDPKVQPFLDHHRIDGTAVLPGVMGLEAMAEAARVAFPELRVASLEGVAFHAPFKFYRDEPRTVTLRVTYDADGADVLAHCSLEGARTLVGRDAPEVTVHFTGTVRLTGAPAPEGPELKLPHPEGQVVDAMTIYETYFHGPAYQVLSQAWRHRSDVAGRFAMPLPPNHEPADQATQVVPRLVELAFQTAGLAEIAASSRMGLPFGFDRLEVPGAAGGEVESIALARSAGDGVFDVQVADTQGRLVLSLVGYRTATLPGAVGGDAFAPLKA